MAFKHSVDLKIFKALVDDNRLEIMELLKDGERCGCELLEALSIGQSTLSHHMRILCDAGLVDSRKEGKWMHYSISAEGAAKARETMEKYTACPSNANTKKCCK